MTTWPASKRCSHCMETGRPPHCAMCDARNIIDDLERQLFEAQGKLEAVALMGSALRNVGNSNVLYKVDRLMWANRLDRILSKEGNDVR